MGLDAAGIGYILSANALAYMGGAIVSGCIIDRYETTAARQLVMVGGWAIVAVSYSMLGPLATLLHSHSAQVSLIAVGMFVQGIGSGGIIVPSLPNAQAGLVSEGEKAIVCSTWNSCYSGGAAIGPIIAAACTHTFGFVVMCVFFSAWGAVSVIALASTVCVASTIPAEAAELQTVGPVERSTGKPAIGRQRSHSRDR